MPSNYLKRLIVFFLFLIIPLSTMNAEDMILMTLGSKGDDVLLLQTSLIDIGYSDVVENGEYDAATFTAVYLFQKENGLEANGIASPETLTEVFAKSEPKKELLSQVQDSLQMVIPFNLSASVSRQVVTLRWSTVENASNYKVYRSITPNDAFVFTGSSDIAIFQDESIVEGETYYYKVTSEYPRIGESEKSGYIKVVVPKPTSTLTVKASPPPTPAPLSYINSEDLTKHKTLEVGMNDPDVAKLKERMYELGYFNNKTVNSTFTATTAEYVKEFQRVNGLKEDGIASPEMQALFFSDYAIPKPIPTKSPTPLSKPKNLKTKVSGTAVTITWKAVNEAEEYRVYRSEESKGYYYIIGYTKTNSYTDTKVTRGNTYFYKIEAFVGKRVSDESSSVKAVMPKPTPTPFIESKIPLKITGIKVGRNSIGSPEVFVSVKNESKTKEIIAFTFATKCYDAYGRVLQAHGFGDSVEYWIWQEGKIKPGKSWSSSRWRWTLYGFDTAYKIEVWLYDMVTSSGETIGVESSEKVVWTWTK